MLSSSLEEFLITIYKMSEERTELKSTDVAKKIDAPLQKTIQALQRMHYQKYIIYSPYQPLVITEKGKEMSRYLIARNNLIEEFLDILQIGKNKEAEKEAIKQCLSYESLEALEKFVLFVRQYPEVTKRLKLFSKIQPHTKLLPPIPASEIL